MQEGQRLRWRMQTGNNWNSGVDSRNSTPPPSKDGNNTVL